MNYDTQPVTWLWSRCGVNKCYWIDNRWVLKTFKVFWCKPCCPIMVYVTNLCVIFRHFFKLFPSWDKWPSAGFTFDWVGFCCNVKLQRRRTRSRYESRVKVPVLHNVRKQKNLAAWRTLEVLQYLFGSFSVVIILYLKKCWSFKENYLPWRGLKFFATLR